MSARTYSWLSLACAVALLAGCPSPAPVKEVKSPKVISFSAAPGELVSSGTVTLTWDTEEAQSVVLYDSNRGAVAGATGSDGSVQVAIDRTTLFVLTATGEDGRTASAVAQVRAGPGDSELVLIAQPSVVKKGGAVTLAWAATNPRGLELATADGAALDLGGQTATGSVTVYPEANTTYVLEADGRRAETTVQIRPNLESFEVSPRSAEPGKPLTFTWKTTAASKLTLSEAQGEVLTTTEVEAEVAEGSFSLPIAKNVPANRVFNFVLRAEGGTSGVVAEQLLTVYVAGQSQILTFDVPRYARAGDTFTAKWTTAEVDHVALLADGDIVYESLDAQDAKAGSVVLPTPNATTHYVLRATGYRGGEAVESRDVSPVVSTAVKSATATPAAITQGGEPVTLQWSIEGARHIKVIHSADGVVFTGSGEAMENQTLTLLPNATGTYELIADNTLGELVVTKLPVTVAQPATFTLSQTGAVLNGESVTLTAPALEGASGFIGFPHPNVEVTSGAAAAEFVDISGTGTRAPFPVAADKTEAKLSLDFETWLFGEKLGGNVVVNADGFLVFARDADTRDDNRPIPDEGLEPFFVAPFWDDLLFGSDSAVFWEVRGEAPERTLIVQWNDLQVKGDTASAVTFQAQIHQTGEVKFVFLKLNAPTATPTIGVQGPTPSRSVVHPAAVAEGDVLTLFGEQPAPMAMNVTEAGPFTAFIKVGAAYLRVPLTFEKFVAANQLAIAEAMPIPDASLGNAGEWVEVANFSNTPVDLAGWTVESELGSFAITAGPNQKTVVAPGGTLVLAGNRDPAQNGGVAVDYEYPASFSLADTPSFVVLSKGSYVSRHAWGTALPGTSVVNDPGPYLALGDVAFTAPHGTTCVGTAPYGSLAQKGTPGALKGCFGYRLVQRPVDYRDISMSGQRVGVAAKVLSVAGTGTQVFGVPLSSLMVSRYGFVIFNGAYSSYFYSGATVPTSGTSSTPDNAAALFGASLNVSDAADSDVYLERIAAGEDLLNPMGHWIVQWHRLKYSTNDDLNFQLKIFDDGSLEYHYGRMESGDAQEHAKGDIATCWLENPTGTLAQTISAKKPLIRPYTAYRFIAE